MGKGKKVWIVLTLMLLVGLTTACGEQEYLVEYGIDGYVWPAHKVKGMDGAEDIRLIGDYLYFLQNIDNERTVKRIYAAGMFSEGEDELNFSGQEILVAQGSLRLELPEDTGKEIDWAALIENRSTVSGSGIDREKEYAVLSLAEYTADEEGNLYYYINVLAGPYMEWEDAGNLLCRQTADGKQAYLLWLSDITGLAADRNGRAFVLTKEGILILNQDGSRIGRIATEEYWSGVNEVREDLFVDSEGRIYYSAVARLNGQYIRRTYEIKGEESFRLEEAEDFPRSGDMEYSLAPDGSVFLFSASSEGSLYEYDRKSGNRNKILNMWDSGLTGFGLREVVKLSPDIMLINYSYEGEAGIFQLTRTSVEELPEREELVIASPNASSQLRQAAAQFNATSDKYRIVIDNYGASYETEGWVCPQLDASLVSSNPPDMIELGMLNIAKYAEKGVLEDLSPYIEKSADLDMADIPDNILEGLTFDDRLACFPTTFWVQYTAARMSQTAGLESWSMEDVYRLSEMYSKSTGELVSDGVGGRRGRRWLLEVFCARYYLEKFVDWEKETCGFDNEEFGRLLTWAQKYGAEPEKEQLIAEAFYGEYEHIPENVVLVSRDFLNFESIAYLELQFGEEVCLMGYPTADGKGCFPASIAGGVGITSNSSHKEAAWEFLEFYLQRDADIAFLPVSKAEIRESYEYLTTEEFLGNGMNGEPKWKEKAYIGIDGELTALYAIPKKQADAILQAIETADFTPLTEEEETVIRIVTEEAESYFSGSKSLEEVTEIIQNRVQLLLHER